SAGGGRKTVVLISSPSGSIGGPAYIRLFTATQRANVALYTFDPRYSDNVDEAIHAETVEARAEQVEGYRKGVATLRTLAENTGGLAAANTNLFDAAVGRMFDDTTAYYQLGFVSAVPKDGRLHDIEVRARNTDVRIRARQGFVSEKAPAPGTAAVAAPRAVDTVLAAPVQRHGLPIRFATVTIPTADPRRNVVNWVAEVKSDFKDGDQLEVKALALDMDARVRGRDAFAATMTGDGDRWLRIAGAFELPDGRYQLRVAASHPASGETGSVFVEIEVPRSSGSTTVGGMAFAATSRAGVSRADKLHRRCLARPWHAMFSARESGSTP
ncbi:MAG: hypothetical protein H0X44_03795, partial [Acidobacteria bacterium]|nr:hypothetical protein [Acidobacteriota bacterium]